jgi:hypothetical protein
MWLAQFVCAPQFFKTPKGLCGHTVDLIIIIIIIIITIIIIVIIVLIIIMIKLF